MGRHLRWTIVLVVLCLTYWSVSGVENDASATTKTEKKVAAAPKKPKADNGLGMEWLEDFRKCCLTGDPMEHDAHQRRDVGRCVGAVMANRQEQPEPEPEEDSTDGEEEDDEDDEDEEEDDGEDDGEKEEKDEEEDKEEEDIEESETEKPTTHPYLQQLKKIGIITHHSPTSSSTFGPYATFINEYYAASHNYSFHVSNTERSDFEMHDPRWDKIRVLQAALHPNKRTDTQLQTNTLEYLVFIDESVIFLNNSLRIEDIIASHPDAHVFVSGNVDTSKYGLLNSAVLILKNSKFTRQFLDRWWGFEDEDLETHKYYHPTLVNTHLLHNGEQGQLSELYNSLHNIEEQTDDSSNKKKKSKKSKKKDPSADELLSPQNRDKVVMLPPNAINSAVPAYIQQQATDAVLNLRNDVQLLRQRAIGTAYSELCRVSNRVHAAVKNAQEQQQASAATTQQTTAKQFKSAKDKKKQQQAAFKRLLTVPITDQIDHHVNPQLKLTQLELLDLALTSYDDEINGKLYEQALSYIEDKHPMFTASYAYALDNYYQQFIDAVMSKHNAYKCYNVSQLAGLNNNTARAAQQHNNSESRTFAKSKYNASFADRLRVDNFKVFERYLANYRDANKQAMARSKSGMGLKEWPAMLSRSIESCLRVVKFATTVPPSDRVITADGCTKLMKELEPIVSSSYHEVLRAQEIQLYTAMGEIELNELHTYHNAQMSFENALAACNKQSSPVACFLYPLYLLGESHNAQEAWTKAISIFDECGTNVYRTQIRDFEHAPG
jgi:hypothetical protein